MSKTVSFAQNTNDKDNGYHHHSAPHPLNLCAEEERCPHPRDRLRRTLSSLRLLTISLSPSTLHSSQLTATPPALPYQRYESLLVNRFRSTSLSFPNHKARGDHNTHPHPPRRHRSLLRPCPAHRPLSYLSPWRLRARLRSGPAHRHGREARLLRC